MTSDILLISGDTGSIWDKPPVSFPLNFHLINTVTWKSIFGQEGIEHTHSDPDCRQTREKTNPCHQQGKLAAEKENEKPDILGARSHENILHPVSVISRKLISKVWAKIRMIIIIMIRIIMKTICQCIIKAMQWKKQKRTNHTAVRQRSGGGGYRVAVYKTERCVCRSQKEQESDEISVVRWVWNFKCYLLLILKSMYVIMFECWIDLERSSLTVL